MPTKRKDGRLQTSVTVENPITGEKKKVYVYGYDLSELEAEKYRIQNASIEEFLNVSTFLQGAMNFYASNVKMKNWKNLLYIPTSCRSTNIFFLKFLHLHQ